MRCTQCGNKFTMLEVPVEERIYGKFSAQFKCPSCKCWLQAGKRFKFLSMLGLTLMAFCAVTATLNSLGFASVDKAILFLLGGAGVTFFTLSLVNMKMELVE